MKLSTSSLTRMNWRQYFDVEPGFLNTASIGVPPRVTIKELDLILDAWRRGRLGAHDFDQYVERARKAWARLAMVNPDNVAIGATVSGLIGTVASSLPDSARVLVAAGDFTSVTFPFLAQEYRGVKTIEAPLERLVDAIDESITLVAVSSVQSSDGRNVDINELAKRARAHGTKLLIDTTQSCGWLPLDCSQFDYTTCAAYKWLLSPRGVAFLSVRPELLQDLVPNNAGWYAGDDIWESLYGSPLRLAKKARRLDTSPAWFSWVGAASALEFLCGLDMNQIRDHDIRLANLLLTELRLPEQNSAIISLDIPDAEHRLKDAGVRSSTRAGRVRASFHLYNDEADVALALNALG